MRTKIIKRAALITLIGMFHFPEAVFANHFMRSAESLMEWNRKLAAKQSELKFNLMTRIESEYLNGLAKALKPKTDLLSKESQDLDGIVMELNAATSSVSRESFHNIAMIRSRTLEISRRSEDTIEKSLSIVDGILAQRDFYDGFCERFAPLVDASEVKADPFNIPIKGLIDYTRYFSMAGSGEDGTGVTYLQASGDPVVEGAALFGFGATAAASAGFLLYETVILGKALGATVSLFGAGNVLLSVTGAAAGIAIGGVALVLVGAALWTQYRNNERKEAAERENRKIVAEYEAARDWYQSQKISQAEYQDLARKHCESPEYAGVIKDHIKRLEIHMLNASTLRDKLYDSRRTLSQTIGKIDTIYSNFKEQLGKQYGNALLLVVEREVALEVKTKMLWDVYNNDIKKRIEATNAAIISSKSCDANYLKIQDLRHAIQAVLGMLDEVGDVNSYTEALTEVRSRIDRALTLLSAKVSSCAGNYSGNDIALFDL
ncbi:MAG: hypothetical protein FJ146_08730 [Deltaproteobacteria bacterium]|nr:hypothetical protein [Deltaproteobacteria bacterium]